MKSIEVSAWMRRSLNARVSVGGAVGSAQRSTDSASAARARSTAGAFGVASTRSHASPS